MIFLFLQGNVKGGTENTCLKEAFRALEELLQNTNNNLKNCSEQIAEFCSKNVIGQSEVSATNIESHANACIAVTV